MGQGAILHEILRGHQASDCKHAEAIHIRASLQWQIRKEADSIRIPLQRELFGRWRGQQHIAVRIEFQNITTAWDAAKEEARAAMKHKTIVISCPS